MRGLTNEFTNQGIKIRYSFNLKNQSGFTLIELMIVIAIIAIIAAIAIPNLIAARKSANETSAVASLRTLSSATTIYREGQEPPGSHIDLDKLFEAGLIDEFLRLGQKDGYDFSLDSNPDGTTFRFDATPSNGTSGGRHSGRWSNG